ncbi:hypothetical protein CR513_43717, partial [Mucuna pruriens]
MRDIVLFKEDTSLSDHLNEFQGIIDQMSRMSIKFEYEILGLLLLNSLRECWETFKGSVLNEEMRRKTQGSSSQSKVLVIENKGRSEKKEREKSISKSKSRYKNVECHYCHKTGHIQKHCFLWKKDKSKEKDDHHHHHDRATTATGDFGVLKIGNDGVTKVIGVDDVCLQTNTRMRLWLRGVKHVPDVRFNLTSVHMLDDGGSRVSDMKKTPPKTPQLNRLAERMNRTLIERVRCMLSEGKLLKHFWGETLYTTVHVINLSPAVALNTEVPNNIWFGKDVNYDHLRVYGCKAFVHVPKDERSKLNMKTRQCIFIGYGHDEYGYRMYDPVDKKLVRSRDVQFMEDETIEDIDKNDEQHNYLGDDFDVPPDYDVEEEHEMSQNENLGDAPEPPLVQLKRSNRQRQSSTSYTFDECVTLIDGEEPECYQESIESEKRQKSWQSKLQKCLALSTTKAELGFV